MVAAVDCVNAIYVVEIIYNAYFMQGEPAMPI